jgi:hypothetical protein
MGKYEPLTHYLENRPDEIWDAGFADVEHVLGFPLPPSAHEYPAWWANQEPGHSQTRGWRDAGWETGRVDLASKRLRFVRSRKRSRQADAPQEDPAIADLWERAHRISGIDDRNSLLKAALTTFIRREAGRGLIALGGTMPDFTVPPRERPNV